MAAIHQDRPFGHGKHIVLMIVTSGLWSPIWLTRWTQHKIDRVREAQDELTRQIDKLGGSLG